MARIFTIHFEHEGSGHSALVTVRQTPFATEYNLSMLSDELLEALPGNRILSSHPGQFAFLDTNGGKPTHLMQKLLQSIAEHVSTLA
ncbi:hypothetical protein [Flaviaesturariibacter amylovorans]|uniref:Uncharacterized protein n=1 Tax=Flaviaesturariibacter amylovorans TaxID=1084520 RepID=A0ABP8HJH5_9BACT